MVNLKTNIKCEGKFPSLFVTKDQMSHKTLKGYQRRLKSIDTELILLENERKDVSYNYWKLRSDLERED